MQAVFKKAQVLLQDLSLRPLLIVRPGPFCSPRRIHRRHTLVRRPSMPSAKARR